MILVAALITLFQLMYKEHWSYVWGAAKYGCVDCSGAFVYAYLKLAGITLPHGSNAIARRWTVGEMLPISQAQPGMAAFKAKEPGEDGYDLPDKYKEGGSSYNKDLRDYYHIGLVDNDPGYVLNSKGENAGFCRDQLTTKNGWDFVAWLKDVSYDGKEEETGMMAKVVPTSTSKGNTVNMREKASTDSPIIVRVPFGSVVEVLTDQGKWSQIEYNGKTGWMQSNYLEYTGMPDDTITDEDRMTVMDCLEQIEQAAEKIGLILGRG